MKQYDPKQVLASLGGVPITGYSEGSFITVAYDEDHYNLTIGADGIGTRSKNNNLAGTIKIKLQRTADFNATLTAMVLADRYNQNSGIRPFILKDGLGNDLHSAAKCWVQKTADAEYAKESADTEWTIRTDAMDMFLGGSGTV